MHTTWVEKNINSLKECVNTKIIKKYRKMILDEINTHGNIVSSDLMVIAKEPAIEYELARYIHEINIFMPFLKEIQVNIKLWQDYMHSIIIILKDELLTLGRFDVIDFINSNTYDFSVETCIEMLISEMCNISKMQFYITKISEIKETISKMSRDLTDARSRHDFALQKILSIEEKVKIPYASNICVTYDMLSGTEEQRAKLFLTYTYYKSLVIEDNKIIVEYIDKIQECNYVLNFYNSELKCLYGISDMPKEISDLINE